MLSLFSQFNMVLNFSRHVFTWGAGRFGQLGNTEYCDKLNLQDVTRLVPPEAGNIVQVS